VTLKSAHVSEAGHVPPEPRITNGYKQTEVGVIPEDWVVKPLHALAEKIMVGIASAATHAYRERGIVMFRNQNIKPGYLDDSDILYLNEDYEVAFRNKRLKSGDLLTARTGYPGTTSIVPPMYEGAQSFTTLITRPRPNLVDSTYLCCLINSQVGQTYFEQNKTGGGQKNVNAGSLKYLPVPLPPTKTEQAAIAGALSDADALIESIEQLVTKKRQIKQGAMQELLTGKKRLPGFNGRWETRTIGEIATPSSEKNGTSDNLPVLSCSKHLGFVDSLSYFKNQVFSKDTSTYKLVRRGQIAYPANHIEEGSIGLQDLYDVALVSPIYVVFSVNEGTNSYFIHRLLKLDSYRQKFKTATTSSVDRRGSLRWPAFSEITVRLPLLTEQFAIASFLSEMETEIRALEQKLAKARMIKQGMIQALLTGKVRLV